MVRIAVEDLIVSCLLVDPRERRARLEELCTTHPDLADALRGRFEQLADMGLLSDDDGNIPGSTDAVTLPEQLGPFRILEVLGRGGMGIVYLAEQTTVGDRRVAVKALLPERVGDRISTERFVREGLLAARLQHPNLCPVLDVGRDQGLLYIAMPLVEGDTLADLLIHRPASGTVVLPGPSEEPDWRRVVGLGVTLARALQVAHAQKLVHRDVKPGNVVVQEDGSPVLLDFGLARDLESDEIGLTRSLDVVGTPAYMAPEQAEPRGRRTDARTDVYGLAATVFECLSGSLPHVARQREDLLRSIANEPATRLRSVAPGLPRDLETVLSTALETNPDHRYESAQAMADDLQRVLDGEPVLASRPGPARRTARWVGRNRIAAALIATMTVGLASSLLLNAKVQTESRGKNVALAIAASEGEWAEHDVFGAHEEALRARELDPDSPRTLGLLMRSLGRPLDSVRFESGDALDAIRVRRDGRLIAFQDGDDSVIHSVDDPDAQPVRVPDVKPRRILWANDGDLLTYDKAGALTRRAPDGSIRWSTDVALGDRIDGGISLNGICVRRGPVEEIVVGTHAGTIVTIDPDSGEPLLELALDDGTVHAMTFVPGTRKMLVAVEAEARTSSVFHVDLDAESVLDVLETGIPRNVSSLQVNRRGDYVTWSGSARVLRLGSLRGEISTGAYLKNLLGTSGRIRGVALCGPVLALSINDRAWTFNLATGATDSGMTSYPHKGAISRIAFHPDGRSLVTTTSDGQVQVRGMRSGVQSSTVVQTQGSQIIDLAVTETGRIVVKATDGLVQVLDPPAGPFGQYVLRHGWAQAVPTWKDEGTLLVSFPSGGVTRILDAETLEVLENIDVPKIEFRKRPWPLELRTPNGVADASLFCTQAPLTLDNFFVADPLSGEVLARVPLEVSSPAYISDGMGATRDGRAVALLMLEQSLGDDRTHITLLQRGDDPTSWKIVRTAEQEIGRAQNVCMLDHDRVVIATYDGSVVVTDLETERVLMRRGMGARFVSASPDASSVLAGFADGALALIDVETGEHTVLQSDRREIVTIAFSADGELAVAGDAMGEITLWDIGERSLVCRWKGHDTRIRRITFSPNGSRIVSTSVAGTLRTWPTDVESVDRLARERRARVVRVR